MSTGREIHLVEEDDGWWSAIDEEVNVASQGETRSEALANLDEAVALHERESGEPLSEDELREIGLEADTGGDEELPEFMQ